MNDSLYDSDIGSDPDSDSESKPIALHKHCYEEGSIRYEEAVEVSFDIIHSKEGIRLRTAQLIPLGIHVNESYPHFRIKSRIYYFIQEDFVNSLLGVTEGESEVESVLVKGIKRFKNCWSCLNRINVRGGHIFFHCKESGVNLVVGNGESEGIGYEVPTYPFRGLFKYIGSSRAQFEILQTEHPDFIIRHNHYSTYAAFKRVIDCYPKE